MDFFYIIKIVLILLEVNELKANEFEYSYEEQKSWCKRDPDCGGQHQSPIAINSLKTESVALPDLELMGYHNMLPDPLNLVNNGHSVALNLTSNNDTNCFIPYISGAMLQNYYIFSELHFHWGAKNNRGSEHILNSIQYPLEMHIIHRNEKYNTNEDALKNRDGFVVLAVFFELREKEHKPLNFIIEKFRLVAKYQCSTTVHSFELKSLLPEDMELFYLYSGSLTTPPCSEAVTWIIIPDPILISSSQIKEFHILRNSRNLSLADNFRSPQPIGKRKIYKRIPSKNTSEYQKYIDRLKKIFFG